MQQQISVITLGIADIARSKRFYGDGFGWKPVFETPEIVFYQMNGLMLGTWLGSALEADMQRDLARPGAFSLAHNVFTQQEVQPLLDRLAAHGGRLLRTADAPPQAGSAAMSPIPTITPGRSPTIRRGRSPRTAA
jgi:catechol 2,3-dioxygenase-like lactoylglutathione lyase family enzyme